MYSNRSSVKFCCRLTCSHNIYISLTFAICLRFFFSALLLEGTCERTDIGMHTIQTVRDVGAVRAPRMPYLSRIEILWNHPKCVRIHIHLVNKHVLFQNSIGKTLI
jgi:hypothetical protein